MENNTERLIEAVTLAISLHGAGICQTGFFMYHSTGTADINLYLPGSPGTANPYRRFHVGRDQVEYDACIAALKNYVENGFDREDAERFEQEAMTARRAQFEALKAEFEPKTAQL